MCQFVCKLWHEITVPEAMWVVPIEIGIVRYKVTDFLRAPPEGVSEDAMAAWEKMWPMSIELFQYFWEAVEYEQPMLYNGDKHFDGWENWSGQ